MKTKLITLALSAVLAVSLLALTACGNIEETTVSNTVVSSAVESSVISETSESLGIYVQDTDEDGTPDKVVDKDGNDLSHLYTLKENGIYEGETLILPMENTQAYIANEAITEATAEPIAEEPQASSENPVQQAVGTTTVTNNTAAYTAPSNGNTNTNKTQTNTAANNNIAVNNNTANTGNTNGGGNTTPAQPAQPQIHQPIYEKKWVVDTAAWTEYKPVYDTQGIAVCNGCGEDITNNPGAHMEERVLAGYYACGSWHSEYKSILIRTDVINHQEQGHWENVLVCNGCTGTH